MPKEPRLLAIFLFGHDQTSHNSNVTKHIVVSWLNKNLYPSLFGNVSSVSPQKKLNYSCFVSSAALAIYLFKFTPC